MGLDATNSIVRAIVTIAAATAGIAGLFETHSGGMLSFDFSKCWMAVVILCVLHAPGYYEHTLKYRPRTTEGE